MVAGCYISQDTAVSHVVTHTTSANTIIDHSVAELSPAYAAPSLTNTAVQRFLPSGGVAPHCIVCIIKSNVIC